MASPHTIVFFLYDATSATSAPLAGATPVFDSYTDTSGTPIAQPAISAVGGGAYKFTPVFAANTSIVAIIDGGAGSAPRRQAMYLRPEDFDIDIVGDIQSRLPSALVGGKMDSSAVLQNTAHTITSLTATAGVVISQSVGNGVGVSIAGNGTGTGLSISSGAGGNAIDIAANGAMGINLTATGVGISVNASGRQAIAIASDDDAVTVTSSTGTALALVGSVSGLVVTGNNNVPAAIFRGYSTGAGLGISNVGDGPALLIETVNGTGVSVNAIGSGVEILGNGKPGLSISSDIDDAAIFSGGTDKTALKLWGTGIGSGCDIIGGSGGVGLNVTAPNAPALYLHGTQGANIAGNEGYGVHIAAGSAVGSSYAGIYSAGSSFGGPGMRLRGGAANGAGLEIASGSGTAFTVVSPDDVGMKITGTDTGGAALNVGGVLSALQKYEEGRWKIHDSGPDANRLVLYDVDGVTAIRKFDLKDIAGVATSTTPAERVPV
jgi:hypothetical protein